MRAYRVAAIAVLLLALTAAGALALRRSVHSPRPQQHRFAASLLVDPDGDVDGGVGEIVALRPALERAPEGDLAAQPCWLRALRSPARDSIPLWRRKLPPDDDPFARA